MISNPPLTKSFVLSYCRNELMRFRERDIFEAFCNGVTADSVREFFDKPYFMSQLLNASDAVGLVMSWEEYIPIVNEVLNDYRGIASMMRL